MSLDKQIKPEEMSSVDYTFPKTDWMDTPVDFKPGTWNYAATADSLEYLDQPNPRTWQPSDEDWQPPENWKEIILDGMRERLDKFRSFKIFMDVCVRCGACADKCHFFLGGGDPRNMPVYVPRAIPRSMLVQIMMPLYSDATSDNSSRIFVTKSILVPERSSEVRLINPSNRAAG